MNGPPSGTVDPELAHALGRLPEAGTEARLEDMRLIRALRDTLAMMEALGAKLPTHPDVHVENVHVPGRTPDRTLLVRLYRPAAHHGGALLFLHGGAFVLGDVYVEEERCQHLAAGAGVLVASVDYALAPEEPFPAALEDAYCGLSWLVAEAPGLGVDRRRVAVGGSSAGAGLAAALSLMARERAGPGLAFQLLVYPMLDDRLATTSMGLAGTPLFSRAAAADAWGHYLGSSPEAGQGGPAARLGRHAHLAAPARAADLGGLPPAYVLVAELDPLRDEGIDYARKLTNAGVPCELHLFPGTYHGFDIVGSRTAVGRRALEEQTEALARALSPGAS
ncbi:MAG TPA: esterase [Acidimicrobiaceae bacterium]|nr:esterase [Acidimicrobiaceae bacterium]